MSRRFAIKESSIEGAGLGCFTVFAIECNQVIGRYVGLHRTSKEIDELYGDSLAAYVLEVDNGFIDGIERKHFTNYINHSEIANVEFLSDGYVKSIKRIKAGDELFVNYGPTYFS